MKAVESGRSFLLRLWATWSQGLHVKPVCQGMFEIIGQGHVKEWCLVEVGVLFDEFIKEHSCLFTGAPGEVRRAFSGGFAWGFHGL